MRDCAKAGGAGQLEPGAEGLINIFDIFDTQILPKLDILRQMCYDYTHMILRRTSLADPQPICR